ncbi:GSCFA domain-containing protein [Hymenobacter gummosus]|nr:GSCFA domain-containing protein [Hymenobacter gummosus]
MFRTELSLRPAAQLLNQSARVLTIGSCFSDVIGERLAGHKVRTLVNPFGTVFNPLAAARLLRAVAGEDTDWQQHLVEARGRWQSYDLHASVGADSPPALLERIEQTVRETAEFARRADVLVWTLGTAYGYRLRDTGEVVNNCHKVPADRFEKELLTAEEIVSAVTEAYALLRQQNPKLRLVLTVSPVRHLKDTLPLNAVSKSVLRVACHYLSELLPGASYFPAYELLLDDLRDYRFYGADMLHPSDVAEQYVWEKFTGVYFDAGFKQFVQEWEGIQRALQHRPLHEGAPEHREFLEQTRQRLQRLLSRNIDVRLELLDVQDRLDALPVPAPSAQPEDVDDGEERIDVGYEDAVITPAVPKPLPEATPAPKVTEPTWEEILSADEPEEEDDETEEPTTANEAGAALPGEPGAGKRRKRKRGGRKHKKKNRPTEEEVAAAGVEAPNAVSSAAATAGPTATEGAAEAPLVDAGLPAPMKAEAPVAEPTESGEPAELVVPTEPALPPVEQPAAEEPLPTAAKKRNRPKRKKPALYAEQPTAPTEKLPAHSPTPEPEVAEVATEQPETTPEEVLVTVPVMEDLAPAPAPAEAVTPATEPVAADKPQAPSRRSRAPRKASKPGSTLDAAAEAPRLPETPALPVLPPVEQPALVSAPATPAVIEPATPEPAAAPAPKRRAASRRKPAATAKAAAPAPTPEPAPVEPPASAAEPTPAAPKRRSRPPRRKPDEPAAS